ncbi:MAG TPA: GTPase HflX, partial [Sphingobacteriaceae bacterium]
MARQKFYDTAIQPEKAVLVGIVSPGQTDEETREYLDELAFLVDTAGGITVRSFTQRMQRPDRATFVGTGKLE